MQSKVATVEEYIKELPLERQEFISKLRAIIKKNLPKGFQETMSYGMIGYVVPHRLYPAGYYCNASLPLPLMNLASQKNFVSLYHMGLYADGQLLKWFTDEYIKTGIGKLDMGKSCIRFRKKENIPLKLIGELAAKLSVDDWITLYEKNMKRT